MQDYQRRFIEFAIAHNALLFGEFKLKSGRMSPYFFNSGKFDNGAAIAGLGRYYAEAIVNSGIAFDMLYGPAYKGIPLAVATAIALNDHHGIDVPYAFNRKEAKQHGEGGLIVGHALEGRVLIVDDVISAGTSVRESVDIIRAAGATPCGVAIALDRMERGSGDESATREVETRYGIPVISIATLEDVIALLENRESLAQPLQRIREYRAQYGVSGDKTKAPARS